MMRYLWILTLAGAGFLSLSLAWPQEGPPPGAGSSKAAGHNGENGIAGIALQSLNGDSWKPRQSLSKLTFKKLPQLKLKGLIKLEGKEPVALLEIDGHEIFRVSKGDKISLTMRREDVAAPEDFQTRPPVEGEGANGSTQSGTDKVQGIRAETPPQVGLKEIQVVLEVMEVDRNGLSVVANPLNERILVR